MNSFGSSRGHLVRSLALVAMLGAGVLMLLLTTGGTSGNVAGAAKADGARKAPVVGKVASVSGKVAGLTVKSPGGREHRLRDGDYLRLGDVIDPDKGVQATLRLKIPNGVSGNTELVFIAPGKGDRHTVTIERTGKLETKVEIGD